MLACVSCGAMCAFQPPASVCMERSTESSAVVASLPSTPKSRAKRSLYSRMESVCSSAASCASVRAPSNVPKRAACPTSARIVNMGTVGRADPERSAAAGTATSTVSGAKMA